MPNPANNAVSRTFAMPYLLWMVMVVAANVQALLTNSSLPYRLNLVDPLIGTANGGHVFPGATLPFGMAKAGADVNAENQGGFSTDGTEGVSPPVPGFTTEGNITGFSHMHDSGTGGVSFSFGPPRSI
jgi:putative alpha-1,2-mannosidase